MGAVSLYRTHGRLERKFQFSILNIQCSVLFTGRKIFFSINFASFLMYMYSFLLLTVTFLQLLAV